MIYQIGFLGYGKMAQAISEGLDKSGRLPYAQQIASALHRDKLEAICSARGLKAAENNAEVAAKSQKLVLAVKPHQAAGLIRQVAGQLSGGPVISLAAGLSLRVLTELLPAGSTVVRAMPNLPARLGRGLTLICAAGPKAAEALAQAKEIFTATGSVLELEENLFDAATALSGCGPAYFFMVLEALTRAGAALGLPWDTARSLVVETALGSAATAQKMAETHLAELRDMVCSPGGSSIEALKVLERGGLNALFMEAVAAAAEKNRALGAIDDRP